MIKVIKAFLDSIPGLEQRLSTKEGALNTCKYVSYELYKYLTKQGMQAKIFHIQNPITINSEAHTFWLEKPIAEWTHYIVVVDNIAIDLTSRQFNQYNPIINITPIESYYLQWKTVEYDDFVTGVAKLFKG